MPSRRRRMMANVRARLLKIPAEPGPKLRIPTAAAQTRVVSRAGIRFGSWESARAFKGIICDDISEFESSHASHAVGSLWCVYPVHGFASSAVRFNGRGAVRLGRSSRRGSRRAKRKVPLRCRLCRNERLRRSGPLFWWAQVRPEAPTRLIARSMCRACGRPQEETLCRNTIRPAMMPPSSSSSAS
jgi:hypothetical protein